MSQKDRGSGGKQTGGVGTRATSDRRASNVPSLPSPLPIEDAINFLISKELIPNDIVNMKNLITGLLHLSTKTNSTILTDGIRAFAAFAQDLETSTIAEGVTKATSALLDRKLKAYVKAAEEAQDAMQEAVLAMEDRSDRIETQVIGME